MKQPYRKKIVIDHAMVAGDDLRDFPVLLCLRHDDFKDKARGGRVAQSGGEDVRFTSEEGVTQLDHEVESYDPASGSLKVWVRVPLLSGATDTILFIHFGNGRSEPQSITGKRPSDSPIPTPTISPLPRGRERGGGVWDTHYRLVLRAPRAGAAVTHSDRLNITDAITIEAWVESCEARAEALQTLVSKWTPLTTFNTFDAYDAGCVSGLDTTGFFGAVFDGRYIYFSPQHDTQGRHGKVLRYDTHAPFKNSSSWQGYDAGNTDGLNTKGYYGAVFDGRYVYFVPRRDTDGFHSRVLRYDTQEEFTDRKSWEAHDVGLSRSYQSAAFDGRYIYFCPGHATIPKSSVTSPPKCASPAVTGMDPNLYLVGNSVVIRYDIQGGFKQKTSWSTFDVSNTGGLDTSDYDGAVFDGRYVYFAPLSTGNALRYDTRGEFTEPRSWLAHDIKPLGMQLCVGAVFDGQYIYFVPYGQTSVVIRYDTRGPFDDAGSWAKYGFAKTPGITALGFDGGMFDGRYIYFVPYYDGQRIFHGVVLRYDTHGGFEDPRSWQAHDASAVDGLKTQGYNAGAFDGRYIYFAPWNDGTAKPPKGIIGHGRVLRYDTLGDQGSFSLRFCDYGHNGGLCAALPGARFIVNTDRGALSISANRKPEPGRHHLAGVFDGKFIRLFVDGILVNEQSAIGRIQVNNTPLSIGGILDGLGCFDGRIEEVRISDTARSGGWIRTQYNNQSDPAGFCCIQNETEG